MAEHTHDPEAPETSSASADADSDPDRKEPDGGDRMVVHPDEIEREFDWRGWALVAAVFVAFLVVPGLIYLYPRVPSTFGLTFWDAYLVLPMIPALVLGLLAVWATTRP